MTAEQLEELATGSHPSFMGIDCEQAITTLARRVIAAERMCDLLEQGECPWREDTSNYREWWSDRKEAATAYREASK